MRATDMPTRLREAVREGLFSGPLSDFHKVRLSGSKCSACDETSLGIRTLCPNCGERTLQDVALSDEGLLWSYTIVRHRPPGDYRGPDPFAPFALGLVELPDGIRVLSPIQCDLASLKIGMRLRFKPCLRHDADKDVVTFAFEPMTSGAKDG